MELHTAKWEPTDGWSHPLPACDSPSTLVIVFGPRRDGSDKPIQDVVSAYPTSVVLGCSTAGEIVGNTVGQDTVAVSVTRFATTRLRRGYQRIADSEQSYDAGLALAARLMDEQPDTKAMFVLCEGVAVNGSALVEGLVAGSQGKVVITGGLAADGERFEQTWVLVDGERRDRYVSAVAFAGPDFRVGHGSRGGWDIFGPQRRVTRSQGNVLYELDGQPALSLYKKYLGERAKALPAAALLFPLAVRVPGAEDRPVVRTINAIDEESQSMTFAGDIPEGALAQLMRANLDRLIDGAHLAAQDTISDSDGAPLAVAISCVGRRLLLGRRTEDELDAACSGLPPAAAIVGFYSYGEISSVSPGASDLHNQTMTITTFWEST